MAVMFLNVLNYVAMYLYSITQIHVSQGCPLMYPDTIFTLSIESGQLYQTVIITYNSARFLLRVNDIQTYFSYT